MEHENTLKDRLECFDGTRGGIWPPTQRGAGTFGGRPPSLFVCSWFLQKHLSDTLFHIWGTFCVPCARADSFENFLGTPIDKHEKSS